MVGASIFASNIGSEHLVGLAGAGATSGVALAHYELHAWCLLVLGWVLIPFYVRSKVFTMPEFLEKRFSPTARWVLSLISLVAYVLTKIAVGIFAGGVVFGTLLPEMQMRIGSTTLDSFWIGSVLVVVLTGLYTALGGMRTVAYTEALQTIILILGSALLTIFGIHRLGGWAELRAALGSEMFNLWKPIIPAGMEGTWMPVKESARIAWYFNGDYPWPGMLLCAPIIGLWYWCTDQYIVQRALGAPSETRGPTWQYLCFFPQAAAGLHLYHPGNDLARTGKDRQSPGVCLNGRCERQSPRRSGAGCLCPDGEVCHADGSSGTGGRGSAGSSDEFPGWGVQRLLDVVHHRLLSKTQTEGDTAPTRLGWTCCHRGHDLDRSLLDTGDSWKQGTLRLFAGRSRLSGAADFCRLLLRGVHEAAECEGLPGCSHNGIPARRISSGSGHSRQPADGRV